MAAVGNLAAIAQLKGGVGKSSLAVTLAVHLHRQGRRTVLLDADPQRTASRWIAQVDPAFPLVAVRRSVDPRDAVIEAVREAQRMGEAIVADPPPSDPAVVRTLLAMCDLAIIPTGDNVEELLLAERTIEAARQEGELRREPIRCVVVRSRFDRSTLSAEAERGVDAFGVPVADTILRHRVAWRLAMSEGCSVFDLPASRHADAIREAGALCDELADYLDERQRQVQPPDGGEEGGRRADGAAVAGDDA